MSQFEFYGFDKDGKEVFSIITDLAAFINSPPTALIFIYDMQSIPISSVPKGDIEWSDIIDSNDRY